MFYFWAQASLYVDVFWTCCLLDILLSCILFECAIVFRPQRSSSPALFLAGHASSTVETFPRSSIGWPVSCFLLEENAQAPCRGSRKDSQPFLGCRCLYPPNTKCLLPGGSISMWVLIWEVHESIEQNRRKQILAFPFYFSTCVHVPYSFI